MFYLIITSPPLNANSNGYKDKGTFAIVQPRALYEACYWGKIQN